MAQDKISQLYNDFKLFCQGAFDFKSRATGIIKKEAMDEMDNFMLLCFADLIGIPSPTTYYTLELLPYMAEDMDKWQVRMMGRKSVFEQRAGNYDMDP